MKRSLFPYLIFLAACSGNNSKNDRSGIPYPDSEEQKKWEAQQDTTQQAEPFALLELYSSEGCSDCPAAEEVLNKITKESVADKSYIYPLAFHVDYWNKLGWKDRFADSAFSNRQRKYRGTFKNEVVYTPQMIVNGQVEFVGSDETKTRRVIDSVMKITPECYFTIHPDLTTEKLTIDYSIIRFPERDKSAGFKICFAFVERGLSSDVLRGENKGKKLQHENVVRYFREIDLIKNEGSTFLPVGGKKVTKNNSLIVFVQERGSMKIVGANIWNF